LIPQLSPKTYIRFVDDLTRAFELPVTDSGHITPSEFKIGKKILKHYRCDKGDAICGVARLAKLCNMSERQASRATNGKLITLGFFSKFQPHRRAKCHFIPNLEKYEKQLPLKPAETVTKSEKSDTTRVTIPYRLPSSNSLLRKPITSRESLQEEASCAVEVSTDEADSKVILSPETLEEIEKEVESYPDPLPEEQNKLFKLPYHNSRMVGAYEFKHELRRTLIAEAEDRIKNQRKLEVERRLKEKAALEETKKEAEKQLKEVERQLKEAKRPWVKPKPVSVSEWPSHEKQWDKFEDDVMQGDYEDKLGAPPHMVMCSAISKFVREKMERRSRWLGTSRVLKWFKSYYQGWLNTLGPDKVADLLWNEG
jgi:hypothetical protein